MDIYITCPDTSKISTERVDLQGQDYQFEHQETYPHTEAEKWDYAEDLFPKIPIPWNVLPSGLSFSLQQMVRSFATYPSSILGAVMAIFASVLGSTVSVSPKSSWIEPLILWFCDIRPSGAGKTPFTKALCRLLYKIQAAIDKDYDKKKELYQLGSLDTKPERPRSFFSNDSTIAGLRNDSYGHGGTFHNPDEISAIINPQKKGTDREALLTLFDGNPVRIVRANKAITVNSRINIYGGVQPKIFAQCFAGKNRVYISDGMIYRFLATLEEEQFIPLTNDTWDGDLRDIWEHTLARGIFWAHRYVANEGWKPIILSLDYDAQECFFIWANEIRSRRNFLPEILHGYPSKLIAYALRMAGVVYCINQFAEGKEPRGSLSKEDIAKGVALAMFYMSHMVQACKLLSGMDVSNINVTENDTALANTLISLHPKLDNGRLAIGLIYEEYSKLCPPSFKLTSPKSMGQMLRHSKLTLSASRSRINGRTGVYFLIWDAMTDAYLQRVLGINKVGG